MDVAVRKSDAIANLRKGDAAADMVAVVAVADLEGRRNVVDAGVHGVAARNMASEGARSAPGPGDASQRRHAGSVASVARLSWTKPSGFLRPNVLDTARLLNEARCTFSHSSF